MKNDMLITDDHLLSKIVQIRNQKVMIDRDLAELHGVETRRLNEQVKRNIERFPEAFAFKLTDEEVKMMVSQNAIPSKQVLGGSLPNAFTEYGVLMLEQLDKKLVGIGHDVKRHDGEIETIFELIKEIMDEKMRPKPRNPIGYKTQSGLK